MIYTRGLQLDNLQLQFMKTFIEENMIHLPSFLEMLVGSTMIDQNTSLNESISYLSVHMVHGQHWILRPGKWLISPSLGERIVHHSHILPRGNATFFFSEPTLPPITKEASPWLLMLPQNGLYIFSSISVLTYVHYLKLKKKTRSWDLSLLRLLLCMFI